MSRAFVSEEAEEARAAQVAERPVSPHANLVTPGGLERIEREIASLQSSLSEASADDISRPRLLRDLRYWNARRLSAQVVEQRLTDPEEVVFGVLVVMRRGGTTSRLRIVGEDEADPAEGRLGWTSPLAVALMGARAGDIVDIGGNREAVEVLKIEA